MTNRQTEGVARSADGTAIGYVRVGAGPALVVAHGSLTTGEQWLPVASGLADRFTCYLFDRRGRGRSGDSADYSLSKECDDIEAVLDTAGPDASLLGHSYGGICALEAAQRRTVSKLILYEPPLPIHDAVVGPVFEQFKAAVAREDLDEALAIGLKEMVRMTDEEIADVRASPNWPHMAALTPTWVRECEEIARLELGVRRYAYTRMATLLLLGTATAPHHIEASRALEGALPHARSVWFEGQGHLAHLTATADVVAALTDFLGDE